MNRKRLEEPYMPDGRADGGTRYAAGTETMDAGRGPAFYPAFSPGNGLF